MGFASLYPSYGKHTFAISRRWSPEVYFDFTLKERGRREDRVLAAPAVSCAVAHKGRAHEHTGSAEAFRPSLRSGFTAYFVLSPVNGSFATVAPEKLASQRTWRQHRGVRTTRLRRTLHAPSSFARFASTASHRTFVTIAIAPHLPW